MPLRIWTTTTATTNSKRIRDDPSPPSVPRKQEDGDDEPPPVVIDQRQRGQRQQQQQERFSYPLPVGATGVVMQGYPPRVKRVEASSPLADKIRPDQVVHAVRIPGRDEYNVRSGGFTARSVQRYLRQHDHVPGRTLVVKDAPPTPDAEDQHNFGRSRTLFGSLNNIAGWNYHHHFHQGTTISTATSTTMYSPRGSNVDNGFVRFPNLFGAAAAAPSLLFPPNGFFFSSSGDYNRERMRRYIDTTTTTTKEGSSSSSSTSSSSPRKS